MFFDETNILKFIPNYLKTFVIRHSDPNVSIPNKYLNGQNDQRQSNKLNSSLSKFHEILSKKCDLPIDKD